METKMKLCFQIFTLAPRAPLLNVDRPRGSTKKLTPRPAAASTLILGARGFQKRSKKFHFCFHLRSPCACASLNRIAARKEISLQRNSWCASESCENCSQKYSVVSGAETARRGALAKTRTGRRQGDAKRCSAARSGAKRRAAARSARRGVAQSGVERRGAARRGAERREATQSEAAWRPE